MRLYAIVKYAEILFLSNSSIMHSLLLPIFLSPRASMSQEAAVRAIVHLRRNQGHFTTGSYESGLCENFWHEPTPEGGQDFQAHSQNMNEVPGSCFHYETIGEILLIPNMSIPEQLVKIRPQSKNVTINCISYSQNFYSKSCSKLSYIIV